jgi:Sensors of blue-light using FAD
MTALEHVAYASEATLDFSDEKVRALLAGARAKNAALGVTGMLLLVDRSFFQILEGAPDAVEGLYEKILGDTRHRRVVKLIQEPIERRDFEDWSMGLARVTSKELASVPGFHDFVATGRSLDSLGEGMARRLLRAFREGSWRARVGR